MDIFRELAHVDLSGLELILIIEVNNDGLYKTVDACL
jgi:hypothetical protein